MIAQGSLERAGHTGKQNPSLRAHIIVYWIYIQAHIYTNPPSNINLIGRETQKWAIFFLPTSMKSVVLGIA